MTKRVTKLTKVKLKLKPAAKPRAKPAPSKLPARTRTISPSRRALLLTESQVLTQLREEITSESLTIVADRYGIKVQQLSDIMYGRANLSKRVVERLSYKLVKLYERVHERDTEAAS